MNYIVLDLEWNQSNTKANTADLPFEIIEIGAVKLNDKYVMIDEFSELIKPEIYHEMHQITSRLIHLQMKELERGEAFTDVMQKFLDWIGPEEYRFCTWGTLDLLELQRNMNYYNMTPLSDGPFAYLDVQKLFSLCYEDGQVRRSLEYGVDMLAMEKDIPFHRAFSDAYYTAKLLEAIAGEKPQLLQKISFDTYHVPKDRAHEIHIQFDTYAKYISREFESKTEAFADKEVSSSKCYVCHRNLRKKLKWFSPNGRHYYCLAYCEKHGYLKGKIRVRKSEDGLVYVVKTTKLISEADADLLRERCQKAKEMNKKRKAARTSAT